MVCKSTHFDKLTKLRHVVIVVLECLNKEHTGIISLNDALRIMIERHIDQEYNWSANFKSLIVIHRALQNIEINKNINNKLKKNFHHIRPYQNDRKGVEFYVILSSKYSKYVKLYIEICGRSDLLTNPERIAPAELAQMDSDELIGNYNYFRSMSTMIFSLFAAPTFCKQTRLMSNVVFMVLSDMIEIYRIYHNHITEVLERFPTFNAS